jgi:hypothetical protein
MEKRLLSTFYWPYLEGKTEKPDYWVLTTEPRLENRTTDNWVLTYWPTVMIVETENPDYWGQTTESRLENRTTDYWVLTLFGEKKENPDSLYTKHSNILTLYKLGVVRTGINVRTYIYMVGKKYFPKPTNLYIPRFWEIFHARFHCFMPVWEIFLSQKLRIFVNMSNSQGSWLFLAI